MTVSLEAARRIIAAAREHGLSSGFNPLTVVVLDAGGHVVAAEREDGSSNKRFEIAHGKAHGAISLGMGSRALMTRAERRPTFITAVTAAIGGSLIPVPGGVLIRGVDGELLGAVGISGDASENDEAAAEAAIISAGLVPQLE